MQYALVDHDARFLNNHNQTISSNRKKKKKKNYLYSLKEQDGAY